MSLLKISSLFHYYSSTVELELRVVDAPEVCFLYRIVLAILSFFVFPYEVESCPFEVCEGFCRNFDGDFIESVDCFCKIAIFIMLTLPIQEHEKSFCFLISSSISFFKDLKFFHTSLPFL